MAFVKKANVVLEIKESEQDYYLDLGYAILDDFGKIIKEPIPTDVNTLKYKYISHLTDIANLEKRIIDLEAELNEYKQAQSVKIDTLSEENASSEESTTTKRKYTRKSE